MTNTSPLSVSEAVRFAAGAVSSLPTMVVTGEVSGFRGPNARSGHCYFQIKDDAAAMDCIVWRGIYAASGVQLRDGLMVQLTGSFDIYERTGRLSFKAKALAAAGEGILRQKVAELARRLEREGLMDPAHKRPIPRFCTRVAVVTSLSGEVIDDVRRTLARRNPLVELDEVGCAVQGDGAVQTILRALSVAAASQPDCILLVRGGGSFEDLMTFNDETLARAVAACPVPVVTGIGHEPDTSICDMVADRRCSTPTAAAESVAPAIDEIVSQTNERQERLARAFFARLERENRAFSDLSHRLGLAAKRRIESERAALNALAQRRCLSNPASIVETQEQSLLLTEQRLMDALPRQVERISERVERLAGRLCTSSTYVVQPHRNTIERDARTLLALSPLAVLQRGYAIVRDEAGHVISDTEQVKIGDNLSVMLGSGSVETCVTDVAHTNMHKERRGNG